MAAAQTNKPVPASPSAKAIDKDQSGGARGGHNNRGFSLVAKLCVLLTIISCLVYANTLLNGYTLDDPLVVNGNEYVQQGIKGIPTLLTTPHLKGYAPNLTDTYRPLSLVMFAVEYQFFGANPAAGHLFSILVFAGTVLLLFLFLHKLFDRRRLVLAFTTALLFALHPIHTEVVANIKSRDELLCFFFSFLSLNLFIDYARQGKLRKLLLGTLCLFLGIISKETAATFILIVPLIFFFYENENRKRGILISICTLAVTAAFIIIRAIIINKYRADGMIIFTMLDNQLVAAPTYAGRLATAILILGNYLKLAFIAYPLICDYSYHTIPIVGFGNIGVLLSFALYAGLGGIAIYRLIKNKKDPWAFGILFYMITLSLFSNIAFIVGATQADRFLFFASVGSCLLIALAIEQWALRSQDIHVLMTKKAIVLFAICAIYGAITISRNADWKDNYTLYKTDAEKSPNNTRLYAFMGTELQKKYEEEQDPDKKSEINNECIEYLQRSLAIYPANPSANAELGTAYILANLDDSAIYHFKRALESDPKKMNAITNLGALYSMQGKFDAAIPYYNKAVMLEPTDTQSWFNLAISYMQTRRYDSSLYAFRQTISLDPSYNSHMAFANIAAVYGRMGNIDSATKYQAIAKQYAPTN